MKKNIDKNIDIVETEIEKKQLPMPPYQQNPELRRQEEIQKRSNDAIVAVSKKKSGGLLTKQDKEAILILEGLAGFFGLDIVNKTNGLMQIANQVTFKDNINEDNIKSDVNYPDSDPCLIDNDEKLKTFTKHSWDFFFFNCAFTKAILVLAALKVRDDQNKQSIDEIICLAFGIKSNIDLHDHIPILIESAEKLVKECEKNRDVFLKNIFAFFISNEALQKTKTLTSMFGDYHLFKESYFGEKFFKDIEKQYKKNKSKNLYLDLYLGAIPVDKSKYMDNIFYQEKISEHMLLRMNGKWKLYVEDKMGENEKNEVKKLIKLFDGMDWCPEVKNSVPFTTEASIKEQNVLPVPFSFFDKDKDKDKDEDEDENKAPNSLEEMIKVFKEHEDNKNYYLK